MGLAEFNYSAGFLPEFDKQLATRLNHRAASFRAVCERLLALMRPIQIIEIGGLRTPGNFAGDGQSSFIFDCLIRQTGGRLWSIDIDPMVTVTTKNVCSQNVAPITADGAYFLSQFTLGPIDLLYLDGTDLDSNEPLKAAVPTMFEFTAASCLLSAGSLVMVDDTMVDNGKVLGKGMLVADYLTRVGCVPFVTGYQMAWRLAEPNRGVSYA